MQFVFEYPNTNDLAISRGGAGRARKSTPTARKAQRFSNGTKVHASSGRQASASLAAVATGARCCRRGSKDSLSPSQAAGARQPAAAC